MPCTYCGAELIPGPNTDFCTLNHERVYVACLEAGFRFDRNRGGGVEAWVLTARDGEIAIGRTVDGEPPATLADPVTTWRDGEFVEEWPCLTDCLAEYDIHFDARGF